MQKRGNFKSFDPARVPSPCFVIDTQAIEDNLQILAKVQRESGAKVLLALKAFSCWKLSKSVQLYLSGTCASGLHETRLGYEEFGGKERVAEVHCYSAGYKEEELVDILQMADHVIFNSFSQWARFKSLALAAQIERPHLQFGIRVNPEHSESSYPIYDPCASGSRMGVTVSEFESAMLADPRILNGISGLHFHTLCQKDFPPLQRTLSVVEEKFGKYFSDINWINFGGGHHITRGDYQVDALVESIRHFSLRHSLQVYLEPGEAIALNAGVLVTQVLDITQNKISQAILDTSATCHMPDVLEMPYRPNILGAGAIDEFAYGYRLGGMTCLAGDVIGDYTFTEPLQIGQRILFEDMAHYTMVKTSTFNGINLPSIALWNSANDTLEVIREFTYEDFKMRLA